MSVPSQLLSRISSQAVRQRPVGDSKCKTILIRSAPKMFPYVRQGPTRRDKEIGNTILQSYVLWEETHGRSMQQHWLLPIYRPSKVELLRNSRVASMRVCLRASLERCRQFFKRLIPVAIIGRLGHPYVLGLLIRRVETKSGKNRIIIGSPCQVVHIQRQLTAWPSP